MLKLQKFNIIWSKFCNEDLKFNSILNYKDNIVIITNKDNIIKTYDKESGNLIKNIRQIEIDFFELKDNTDSIILNDYLFLIDKERSICKILNLNNNIPIAVFGFKNLEYPTNIHGIFYDNIYLLFIVDDYTNTIIKYEIKIEDNKIFEITNKVFLKLYNSKLISLCFDLDYKRILIYDNNLKILNLNGDIINELNYEAEKIIIHNNHYILINKKINGNMLHKICRESLNYNNSYSHESVNFINDLCSDGKYIYIIDNNCSILKIDINIKKSYKNYDNILKFISVGLILYSFI